MEPKSFRAGDFRVEVTGPHPCWVAIITGDANVRLTLRHDEIVDLQFALERARQEAKRRLGADAHEVE